MEVETAQTRRETGTVAKRPVETPAGIRVFVNRRVKSRRRGWQNSPQSRAVAEGE